MVTEVPRTLISFFKHFKEMQCEGIAGVVRIESGKPGPTLGITACTHGNEPSGLAVFKYLLREKNIKKELRRGTLYLVINNIRATEKFFSAKNDNEIRKSRYCDVNMNRLPEETPNLMDDIRYETVRARELYPIWRQFEIGLDIHSTLDPSEPMIISRGGEFHPALIRGFPIQKLISNIDQVQTGVPAFAFYGGIGSRAKVFAIEAGQHADPNSFDRAAICAISLLQNLDMLPSSRQPASTEYEEYHINSSILFPDLSFDFVKDFKSYDKIYAGELLARNTKGEEIQAPFDGHLILPTSKRGKEKDISEEASFISQPVRIRRVG